MIDDPAYPIIERLRREQRNARRRILHATSSVSLPTAQWVRSEYSAEMQQLHRPLRSITARSALEWTDLLSSLRRRNLDQALPGCIAATCEPQVELPPARARRLPCRQPSKPTAEWTRAEYRGEMRQLGMAQRTITARNVLHWAHILSSIRRWKNARREATLRHILTLMRPERVVRAPTHEEQPIAFPLADLATQYNTMLMLLSPDEQEHFQSKPHRIVLTSASLHTRELTMDVKNCWHGENWLKQIADDETEIDSKGTWWCTGAPLPGLPQLWSAFAEASIRIERIAGGCFKNKGRSQVHTVLTSAYKLGTFCPRALRNDCALECLRHIGQKHHIEIAQTNLQLRKECQIATNKFITVDTLLALCTRLLPNRRVVIATTDFSDDTMDMTTTDYIILQDRHYQVVESCEKRRTVEVADKRITRGVLALDFETRPSFAHPTRIQRRVKDPITGETTTSIVHSHRLVDTICHARYTQNGDRTDLPSSTGLRHVDFTTNRTASSARQLIDWLKGEAQTHQRYYQVVAYNGSRFDYYLLLGAMTAEETRLLEPTLQLRGKAIIAFEMNACMFKDPNLFLTGSLDYNCKAFKVNCAKQTEFTLANGTTVDNMQLCFYKPELDVWDFLDLQHSEPDFWRLYTTYCDMDCGSLYALWKCFRQGVDDLTMQMGGPTLLAKCRIVGSCTIGSHAKKVLTALTRGTYAFQHYEAFFYGHQKELGWTDAEWDASVRKRYAFVSKCKRGGISHVNQPGRHDESVLGVDISSQYSTALMNMLVAAGKSWWVKKYEPTMHGFYEVRRLRFVDGQRKRFRPIAYKGKNGESLDWIHQWSDPKTKDETIHIDSQMLEYLIDECGLVSFEVVEGLVSKQCLKGEALFGRYVNPLYREKARQDALKDGASGEYNVAMREACKLLLNSLTGKLVEDSSRYYKVAFTNGDERERKKGTLLNGLSVVKVYNRAMDDDGEEDDAPTRARSNAHRLADVNVWVSAGVCVYSYSKILLFKYIDLLPNQADDVIHVETDGIYFPARCLETFQRNLIHRKIEPRFPLALGGELGNLKVESESAGSSYWLGKKFYYYQTAEGKEAMRIKGMPQKTIAEDGTSIQLVDRALYERVYAGHSVTKEYATLTKQFFGKEVKIQAHRTQRTVRPMCMYESYS